MVDPHSYSHIVDLPTCARLLGDHNNILLFAWVFTTFFVRDMHVLCRTQRTIFLPLQFVTLALALNVLPVSREHASLYPFATSAQMLVTTNQLDAWLQYGITVVGA